MHIAAITQLIARLEGEQRVMAICGPPGVGKTWLAQRIVARWPGRAVWCAQGAGHATDTSSSLCALRELLFASLGLQESCVAADARQDLLIAHTLRAQSVALVVLDGVSPVPEVLDAVARWCAHAPSVQVLLTCQARVNDPNVAVTTLAPLRWGARPDGRPSEAATLLAWFWRQGAGGALRVDSPPCVDVLERLAALAEGVPLALSLVAARARLMTPAQLLDAAEEGGAMLHHEPALARALHGAWLALDDATREAALACACFPGAFDAPDAVRLIAATCAREEGEAWRLLTALIDRSLLRQDVGRLSMRGTLRAFVQDRVDQAARDAARAAFARVWSARAEVMLERNARRPVGCGAVWFLAQRAHVLEATRYATPHERVPLLLVQHALQGFIDGPSRALLVQTREALDAPACASSRWLPLMRCVQARHDVVLDSDRARALATLEALRDAADGACPVAAQVVLQANVSLGFARVAMLGGRLEEALAHVDAAIQQAMASRLDGVELEARVLAGMNAQWRGELEEARASWRIALALARQHDDSWCASLALSLLAQAAHLDGALDEAARCYDEAWTLHAETPGLAAPVFIHLARLCFDVERGEYARVLREAAALLELCAAREMSGPEVICRAVLLLASHGRGARDEAAVQRAMIDRALTRRALREAYPLDALVSVEALDSPPRALPAAHNVFMRFLARAARAVSQRDTSAPGEPLRLRYEPSCRWFAIHDQRHDLRRRHPTRRALRALLQHRCARPGEALAHAALIDAAWPGELITPESASGRLRVLVHGLRAMGLREVLLTSEGGYLLDPALCVEAQG